MSDLTGINYCIKYLLFIFNFVFWLLGITILAVGIWVRVDYTVHHLVQSTGFEYYYTSCYLIIASGCIIMIIGFLGCVGALREQPCMLITYFAFLFIVFIMELAACAYVFSVGLEGTSLDVFVRKTLERAIDQYNFNDDARSMLDTLQTNLYCCGSVNWMDYEKYNKIVPDSCRHEVTGRQFEIGCLENVSEFVDEKSAVIGGLSLVICLLEVAGMIFSLILCRAIKNEESHFAHH